MKGLAYSLFSVFMLIFVIGLAFYGMGVGAGVEVIDGGVHAH